MSNAAHALPARLRAAAEAIANARAGRRGAPLIANVLDALPETLFAEVVEDARAALDAADADEDATIAGPSSKLDGTYADALRLDLDAGTLLILMRDRAGRASAVLTARTAEAAMLGHGEAQLLWGAIAAILRTLPNDPPTPPDQPESTS